MAGKNWIACGALLAAVGVILGAIGTHVLKETLHVAEPELATFDVAVRYQLIHAIGLILIGVLAERWGPRSVQVPGLMFLTGIVLFSGGIYAWLATGIKPFVHIVPVGGTIWIVGWLVLAWAAFRRPNISS